MYPQGYSIIVSNRDSEKRKGYILFQPIITTYKLNSHSMAVCMCILLIYSYILGLFQWILIYVKIDML